MSDMTNDEGGITKVATLAQGAILQPAKHGFVIDMEEGARRTQVRVFEFTEQPFQGGVCEMPEPLTVPQGIARLREAMEVLRESVMTKEVRP